MGFLKTISQEVLIPKPRPLCISKKNENQHDVLQCNFKNTSPPSNAFLRLAS